MEYRDTVICRVMLLTGLDRATAARRVEEYIAGRLGRAELYAPPGAAAPSAPEPEPAEAPPPQQQPAKRRAKYTDAPRPDPDRFRGPARLNMEALGDEARRLLSPRDLRDYAYEPDAVQATILRIGGWIRSQGGPPPFNDPVEPPKKTPPDG